jgi:ubiquinone/menaquinone biosynthesis C-methylase UbiE
MKNYWTEYWSQGHITSFGQDIKNNYTGKLKQSWLDFSAKLSDGSNVLDIGTGNGALIKLIQDANGGKLKFIGIDKATVSNQMIETSSSKIISNVNAEALPFEDCRFDAIITQFAIEYSDLSLSISELFRVLKSGGLFQIICHDIDSDIVKPNLSILESALRVQSTMLTPLQELITLLKKGNVELINKKKFQINELINNEKNINLSAINGTLFTKFYQFILKNSKIDLDHAYNLFNDDLVGLIYRLQDLKRAALNSKNIDQFLKAEFDIHKKVLIDPNKFHIGTLYNGCKRLKT